jgi:type II secretory pathway component GspD/PulD (secretin)
MSFTRLPRVALLLAVLIAGPAAGQASLEVIALRHRTVEQVLPALRPLMEPGATLTGQGTQLIVRASPANVAELRRALEAIDRPAKRLQISVRLDEAADRASQSVDVSGTISNRDARVDVRAAGRESSAQGRVDQRIQVLDGGRAYIFTGQETPYRDTATGFEAVPRLAGETVQLDILQQRQTSARQQGLATTVSARLGEWFEVGQVIEQASTNTSRRAQSRRIWLKVEELRP